MTVLTDSADLQAFCARHADQAYITVDTEFLRDSTYWPRLCLLQVAGPEEAVAIDTLAEGLDLAPLIALFDDPKILKVFHAGRQDLEIFYHMNGRLPAPVFDTQVAAMVCGFGDSVGYDTLVKKITNGHIDKSSRFTDWARRPLNKKQINYALADVIHLRPVYEKLRALLEKSGRSSWLDEEMDILTSPDTYRLEPREAWRRLKSRSRDRRYLALLRELAAWREIEAQRRDVPRNRILRDESLFEISAHKPTTPEDLAKGRGISNDLARGKIGRAILEAVEAGLAVPKDDCPSLPPRVDLPDGIGPLTDLLKVLLKMRCEDAEVAQKLVANNADLERIAAQDDAPVPALSGWRRKVFGEDALRLKAGKVALGAEGNRIKVIDLQDGQPAA